MQICGSVKLFLLLSEVKMLEKEATFSTVTRSLMNKLNLAMMFFKLRKEHEYSEINELPLTKN